MKDFVLLFLSVKKVIRDDRGSVEAGLTLIPLTILFLVTAQVVFASQWGNATHMRQQSDANRIAISGSIKLNIGSDLQNQASPHLHLQNVNYVKLLGGGQLVISEQNQPVPLLANFPGLKSERFFFRKQVPAVSEVFTK